MPHRKVYTWIEDLRGTMKSPESEYNDRKASHDGEGAASQLQTAMAKQSIEDKQESFAEANDRDDRRRISDSEESNYEEQSSMEHEVWRPSLAPEPLRLQRSDTVKSHDIRKVTETEWNSETQTWSTTSSSARAHPNESVEDLQKTSNVSTKSRSGCRQGSEAAPSSQPWTLTPSDAPYGISWLADRDSGNDAAKMEKMPGNPYEVSSDYSRREPGNAFLDPNTARVQRPSTVYQPDRKRDTLMPGDSISCVGLPTPPVPAVTMQAPPLSMPYPSTPYPSTPYPSTPSIPTIHRTAETWKGEKTSLPPQLPPTLQTSPRCSEEIRPNYHSSPSRDTEMPMIKHVPTDSFSKDLRKQFKAEDPVNGQTAWLHALAGFLVVFNCWGITNAYGLFQAYYEQVYLRGTSPSSIAWIGSTQLCLVFGLGVPVGRLVDRGYFPKVFLTGTFLMCLGLFSTAWCNRLGTLWLTQGLLTGLGMGMIFCSGLVAMMTWFDEQHLSSAMALCAAGSCVGGIVYILIARTLLPSHGFKVTLLVLATVTTATMIPATIIFRVREEGNIFPCFGRRKPRIIPITRPSRSGTNTWRSFTEPAYLLVALGMFFSFLGVYFGFVYIISYGYTVLHMDQTAATNLLIFMLTANLPGRFLPALISDKCISPLNTIIPSLWLSSAVIWLWAASTQSTASLTIIACYYGFVSAGVQVLYAPTMYSFCVDKTQEGAATDKIGIRAGGISTCIGLACLIGTPIGGALISYRTDRGLGSPYLGAQVFAGVSLVLGGCFLLGSRVARVGWERRVV